MLAYEKNPISIKDKHKFLSHKIMQWNISTPESCPEQQYIEIFFNTKNWCYFSYHWHTPLRSSTCPRPGSGCSRWWCWHGSAWRGCPPPPEHPSSPSPTDDSGWSPSIPPNCCPERMQCQFSKNYFYKLFWVEVYSTKRWRGFESLL